MTHLIIGTRTSQLALWQTNHVMQQLQLTCPGLICQIEPFVTKGDKTLDKPLPQIGGKGLFTAELEAALRDGRIDLAVHSQKDLPVDDPPGLATGAVIGRADVRDVLVARHGHTLATLPPGAVVGTSSLRRQAQVLQARPDLVIRSIRGNVETRVRKVLQGDYDATVLAAAGLIRLKLTPSVTQWLPLDVMLPAPGQGALAVQCRADDEATLARLGAVDMPDVRTAVTAERTFLARLQGGCSMPVGAHASWIEGTLSLTGFVGTQDGSKHIRVAGTGTDPVLLGERLARVARARGAMEMLSGV